MTSNQQQRSVTLTISNPTRPFGYNDRLSLKFGGAQVVSFRASDTASTISAAIVSGLSSIAGASVAVYGNASTYAGSVLTVVISVTAWQGLQNNFYRHDGAPPLGYFFCDVTGTANGLVATTASGVADALYSITISGTGASYFWSVNGSSTLNGPYALNASGGNTEIDSAKKTVVLTFSPATGRVPGEAWTLAIAGGSPILIPATTCAISDTDLSLKATNANFSGATLDFSIVIGPPVAATGVNTFKWMTNEAGSSFSAATPITAGVAQALKGGAFVTFASAYGHAQNATWHLTATAPSPSLSLGRSSFMTAVGSSSTLTGVYRIAITDGTTNPATFQYSVRKQEARANETGWLPCFTSVCAPPRCRVQKSIGGEKALP